MSQPALHQLIIGATQRDAITQNAQLWQSWLRKAGYTSEVYAVSIDEECKGKVRPWHSYSSDGNEEGLIYHHSLGSPVVDELIAKYASKLIPVYHNVTPARWFADSHPELARLTRLGVEQLKQLATVAHAGLGDSDFNCAEMLEAGFKSATTVPITFDLDRFKKIEPIPLEIESDGPIILFVGRLAPNKAQEDLVRLLYACQQLEPGTQLVLVGSHWMPVYVDWVRYVAEQLGVANSVHLLGSVSFEEMAGAYQAADLYVSLSEHEGFGMPLIESMYFQLPILAYRSTAVTGTLGDACVTIGRKAYGRMAHIVMKLWQDKSWQQRIIERQQVRLQDFLEPQVKKTFFNALKTLKVDEMIK